ncbi:MAG: malate dehydrogenase [Candidatus Brocadia sp. AMX2]|uniref:Malate dehydrogenase n=1 Tax=Candidatus Brocadia sinica JPN1 TaxID=1197129 RepID=A0ABQ0JX44_9BACT|nr:MULTISPECIES: malate dehydrogenase [Brocadia]KXK30276.1 MAG: malate dehydrogenase [Candidatus Brocadia sinica]MBC6933183.1 malate dehydrogenase [Candidatus Brocadia sp.]MBL1169626.1 malate dehydrogenase [Candidatus Brocadia sp. AMX1]NOG40852.1 malate dehydrogenase [Planctomycetota bacterium]KAA0243262.1 MAG: malate dehydrogenase [Candidatus Brocadia sp. AMX2]
MARKKIAVVGAGNVGATTAQRLAEKEIGDVILVDIIQDMPQGKALDILESAPVYGYDSKIIGTNEYEETRNSDIVVVTSGVARKPGMSRDDLLKINAGIVKGVVENIVKTSPNAILIVVSNPLDAMTYVAHKISRFPKNRIMGMAGVLDAARFSTFIAMDLNVSVENIHAFVLGGHGDTMVPSTRYTTVAGVSVEELIPKSRLEAIVKRTREGGAEIVNLLKTGSAFYAPSAAVAEMAKSIVKDKKKILPCAALCEGEYGINGLFVGVPVKLGERGIEQVFEIKLNNEESAALKRSAEAVKTLCDQVDKLL